MSNRSSDGLRAPKNDRQWEDRVEEYDLQKTTIHSTDFASASKFDYKQFLLLRVLWKEHKTVPVIPIVGMEKWVALAKEKLDGYEFWSTYCHSYQTKHESLEGTFAVARYYQCQVATTEPKAEPKAFHTPISSRTRGAVNQVGKGMAGLRLEPPVTPTRKGLRPSHGTPLMSYQTDDMSLDEESSPSPSPSPMKFISPITRELENILYPPTKDEQTVNTALIVFLNALAIHFELSSQWTCTGKPLQPLLSKRNSKRERTDILTVLVETLGS
ncbi:hypothetical protein N7445_008224 [Penicillium cf. griseofulvum]|nr:hypothetical protein N7445_008224 [Penicillium cf. griseofulvum]